MSTPPLRSSLAVLVLYFLACFFIMFFLRFIGYYHYGYFVWEILSGSYLALFHLSFSFFFSVLFFWPYYKQNFGFLFSNPHKNKQFYIVKTIDNKMNKYPLIKKDLLKMTTRSKIVLLVFFGVLVFLNPSPKAFNEYIEGMKGYSTRHTFRKYNFLFFSIYVDKSRDEKSYLGVCLNFIELES